MSRQTKFRGKRIDTGEWVYGDYYKSTISENVHIIVSGKDRYSIDPKTKGEFTGLNDREGTPIYEGDILSIDGGGDIERLKVLWSDKDAAWFAEWFDGECYELRAYVGMSFCEVEVIGNVHENPELLISRKVG